MRLKVKYQALILYLKKADYDAKKIRNGKKNTTSNYDKFMTNILDAKIKKKS